VVSALENAVFPTDAELIRAIETGLLEGPTIPDQLELLDVSGVQGHFAHHVSHNLVNNVGDFNVADAMVDDVIEQLLEKYRELGNSACWWIGPNSKPSRLKESLEAHGIQHGFIADGFASTDLAADIRVNSQIRVEIVSDEHLESSSRTFAAGFAFDEDDPLPEDAALLWMTAVQSAPPYLHSRNYAAYLDGVEGAIAVANMFLIPGTNIVELSGASTLPEHRGKGAYTALLAARFSDAVRFGAKAAVTQATPETSSPICQRVGMRRIFEFPILASEPTQPRPVGPPRD
jgi:hypothetical protein